MHYFSGKGCSEFLESMHYCIGILNTAEKFGNAKAWVLALAAENGKKQIVLGLEST